MQGNTMKRIGNLLIGDATHFTFEERIFNFSIFLGFCMTVFATIMDIRDHGNFWVNLTFSMCWLLSYHISKLRVCFKGVSIVSFGVLVFIFFPYNWILSGGSISVIPFYAIVIIAIICIVLSGAFRLVMVLSMLGVELLLIVREVHFLKTIEATFKGNLNLLYLSIHLFIIMIAMAVMIIVYSNIYMKEKTRREVYAKTIEEQYTQQLYSMDYLEALIYKLKSERHDFNNHLGVIYGLLEDEEVEKAGTYVSKLVKNAHEYQNIVNIPYITVRVMMNYTLSTAEENSVELRLNIHLPEKLKINEFDLTIIMGNLLNNAMEACAKVNENSRFIALDMSYRPNYLTIKMENPVSIEHTLVASEKKTTKRDAENHGFGLENIDFLVNKHNGIMKIECKDGLFKVDIALLIDGH